MYSTGTLLELPGDRGFVASDSAGKVSETSNGLSVQSVVIIETLAFSLHISLVQ